MFLSLMFLSLHLSLPLSLRSYIFLKILAPSMGQTPYRECLLYASHEIYQIFIIPYFYLVLSKVSHLFQVT